VRLPFGDVARFLRAADHWGSRRVTSVSKRGESVVVKGGGVTRKFNVTEFRIYLNSWAHCLDPARYPTFSSGGLRLPQTVPSKWFSTSKRDSAVVLTGRGWGHGVGLVQWGAYGKALRGLSYRRILAAYYGGLRPRRFAEPTEIRIGIAVGLKSVIVQGTGQVSISRAGAESGPWLVTGGKKLRVRHTKPPPTYITAGRIVEAPVHARSGRNVTVTASVPETSVARLVLRMPGPDLGLGPGKTVQPGVVTVSGEVLAVSSGRYRLQLELTDGIDIVRSAARPLRVTGSTPTPSPSSPSPTSPSPSSRRSSPVALAPTGASRGAPLAIGVGGVVALAIALLILRRTRRRARPWRG
jgi:hypothetical protein